jgi:hypothetical protein
MTTTFLICAIVTAISAFISLGFSVSALMSKGEPWENALYFFSRSLALAVISVSPSFPALARGYLL